MNSPSTVSSGKTHTVQSRCGILHFPLFLDELKRGWYTGLLYAVILFFVYPVGSLIALQTESDEEIPQVLAGYFSTQNLFLPFFALFAGIISAIYVCGYFFDRRRTNFVCSLPVRRGAFFVTKLAGQISEAVLAWIPSIILMLILAIFNGSIRVNFGTVTGGYLASFGAWFCMYFYFLASALFVCSLCGTVVMSGMMFLLYHGLLPVVCGILYFTLEEFYPQLNRDYYFTDGLLHVISGFYRIFENLTCAIPLSVLMVSLAVGAVLTVITLLLVRCRPAENAGEMFVFPKVRSVIRYICMILAASILGLLFNTLGGFGWTVFGILSGAVLSWMLCNTIFFKTPHMMFTGKRGMVILTIVLLILGCTVKADLANLDDYIPASGSVKSVTVNMDGRDITATDTDIIAALTDGIRNGETENELEDGPYSGSDYTYYGVVTYHLKNGFPLSRRMAYPAVTSFATGITQSPDFASQYVSPVKKAYEMQANYVNFYVNDYRTGASVSANFWKEWNAGDGTGEDWALLGAYLDAYQQDMERLGSDCMQQFCYGYLSLSIGAEYYTFPLFDAYTSSEAILDRIVASLEEVQYGSSDSVRTFSSAELFVLENGAWVKQRDVTEEELQQWMAEGRLACCGYSPNLQLRDGDCYVVCNVKEGYVSYDDNGIVTENVYDNEIDILFLEGMAP